MSSSLGGIRNVSEADVDEARAIVRKHMVGGVLIPLIMLGGFAQWGWRNIFEPSCILTNGCSILAIWFDSLCRIKTNGAVFKFVVV